ncbi:MAG: hypothetical protein WAV38_30075, partial [Xanthobacteraceae bacterium]
FRILLLPIAEGRRLTGRLLQHNRPQADINEQFFKSRLSWLIDHADNDQSGPRAIHDEAGAIASH